MKRICTIIFLLFVFARSAFSQITGSGTLLDPYVGTLTSGSFGISGIKYISSITISGGTLTIDPGSTVIAIGTSTTLTIDGNGILNAVGSSGTGTITFTSDLASWNRIVYSSSGTSIIDHCIIEKGSTNDLGGGLYIASGSITISNSLIKGNYAAAGGGIYILNCSPTIFNCIISNNIGNISGGGIVIYQVTASPISIVNCIVENNTCYSGGGGGGIFIGESENVFFYDCVIASNFNQSYYGHNIRFYLNNSGNQPKFYNTIVWGSSNPSISYAGQSSNSSDFNFCALSGGGASSYTSCIDLNINNNALDGPNFNDPNNLDYSIKFISPCRDAGTTPSTPVPYDIIGNPRLGAYDIGAYEVQYNRWTGTISGDWFTTGNWSTNNVPARLTDAVIGPSAHDPSITLNGTAALNSLSIESSSALLVSAAGTLNSSNVHNGGTVTVTAGASFKVGSFINGGTFILQPTGMATITSLTNNGIINLNSNIDNMFSLIFDSYSGTGNANVAMNLTGGGGQNQWAWHYVAIPTPYSLDKSVFTSIEPYNLMEYDDANIPDLLTASDNNGWL